MEASAKSNLKRVSLELGGKSPLIIFADSDRTYIYYRSANSGIYNYRVKLFVLQSYQKKVYDGNKYIHI